MSIWFAKPQVEDLNQMLAKGQINRSLGLEVTEVGDDFIRGTMPADERTFQPYGVVHGGANVVLAETLGSIAGYYCVDTSLFQVFGQEVNASHIRSVSSGLVTATVRPIHLGSRSQIWEIRLENDQGKLSCLSKLTTAVVPIRR
ncbi:MULTISPECIES: hotdog fold thioesterase [Alteromonadaceae]|uniref:hotdog fold thioesterase n=1 Tax=Alteromonadaceae TaxID=72275 RepID=UPI001C093B78|nr:MULTISPECIES: hotdog fold thioesterase [Aliiglaciecola]MBU2878980.1 hotdog fold thioesterase [Aliiglaciecola lipolytica]MDO6710681.1 hotdog fold thioesterase [Aliiglaciecola sp. 2_MG-2023]MDO6751911.1 hotdog fold thioesterase [Aliiglaciecola sp. 1_MG-2023]